jgi:hypothetical protein
MNNVKIETWSGHIIRLMGPGDEWRVVIKGIAEALGYLPETCINVSKREFLSGGRFILSKEGKVYYECDFYGDSEDILIPNVVIELEKYLLESNKFREQYVQMINSALYSECLRLGGIFVTKHPSDYSELAGAIALITDYDKWLLNNQIKVKFDIADEDTTLCGVYFVQADNGLTKIGCTRNIINRFSALKTSSPCDLKIVGFVNSADQYTLERKIHTYLSDKRVRGEWFKLSSVELMALNERFSLGLSVSERIYQKYCEPSKDKRTA